MISRKQNAINLYMEGIRDGNAREAVTKYTGDRYTQHSTGVKDGIEGFVEFFGPFIARNPIRDIKIVRALEDGQYVFVQAYQELNNGEAKWITMDLFDTDADGKIIEHWDVIGSVAETTVSGHSQIDGPTEIQDLDKTEENKAIVRGFLTDVLQNGKFDKLTEYVSKTTYIQHNPQVGDGLEGLAVFVEELGKKGLSMQYLDVFKVIGEGNFVASYSKMALGDDEYAVFDLFRLESGLIVEHWDNMEVILPKEQWGNSGKF